MNRLLDEMPPDELTAVQVEVAFPETPFGGVQVFGVADEPIQVILREGQQGIQGEPGPPGAPGIPGPPGTDGVDGGISEQGITPLVMGQAYIDVVFGSVQTDAFWHLGECVIVNTIDSTPLNIWPGIVTSKTTTGFRLQLSGLPDTGNYILYWAISGVSVPPVEATTYSFSGPSSGTTGDPSTVFTIALLPGTTLAVPVTVTPDDGGGGGTFIPTSVMLTAEAPSGVFTYTPSADGVATIGVTNDGSLIDPADISFTASSFSTSYTLTGPSGGDVGVASTNFTVALPGGGSLASPVTVTPSDGGGGGTFTPTTVSLSTGTPSATFTYTPASAGAKTISVTNSGILTNPANLTYTAVAVLGVHLLNTLISYWKLDDASGATRIDSHGTNHLTDVGSVGVVTGAGSAIINGAIYLPGTNTIHLECANNASLQVTGDFTWSLWIRTDDPASSRWVFAKWDGGSVMEYGLGVDPSTGVTLNINSSTAYQGSPVTIYAWYHLVCWYDSSDQKVRLRVNDATTYVSAGTVALASTTTPLIVGAVNTGGAAQYGGCIDEIGFWKRVLTAAEMTALYNAGAGLPYSSFTA